MLQVPILIQYFAKDVNFHAIYLNDMPFFLYKKIIKKHLQYCTQTTNPAHAGVNDFFFLSLNHFFI